MDTPTALRSVPAALLCPARLAPGRAGADSVWVFSLAIGKAR